MNQHEFNQLRLQAIRAEKNSALSGLMVCLMIMLGVFLFPCAFPLAVIGVPLYLLFKE